MSAFPYSTDVLSADVELLNLPDIAERLGVPVTRVHQMLRDHQLLAIRRDGVVGVPARFFDADGAVVKMLTGVITVMRDSKYTDEEILEWVFTDDPTLPGKPVDALHGDLAREVVRRAAADPF
ncbi:Rv2175c family DNA-binding protein [Nocardia asteroides]|uniref:Rv2175c family DNA-binding protein n=1 Tax=Nocardia asteroides TaxID=1824 RepID=UPI001E4BF395|nr:Rv2175c family DNA-binding protein [Nocardia asteroides]UGT60674.1 DNA-binding protein [Nocardia asteroides]